MRRLAAAIGALVLAYATAGFGLGFGPVEVVSALNEPLQARIPLLAVKPEERDGVSVKIASPSTFTRFGVSRAPILDHIKIEIVPGTSPTRMRVLLTSKRPIREPFLTFLVEANWSGRRAIREYTILLDPPVSAPVVAAKAPPGPLLPAAEPPAPVEPLSRREPARRPSSVQEAPAPPPQDPPPPATADETGTATARQYGPVEPLQTLWSIAAATRPNDAVTMDQMLLAIYQANVEDFDGNMNLMFEGAMLAIPGAAEIAAIDRRVASREVADQARAFARLTAPPPTAKTATAAKGELRLEPPPEQAAQTGPADPDTADAGNSGAGVDQPQGAGSDTLAALAQAARAGAPEAAPGAPGQPSEAGQPSEPRLGHKDSADPSAAAPQGQSPGDQQTLAAGASRPEAGQDAAGVDAAQAPANEGNAANENEAPRTRADADGGLPATVVGGANVVALTAAAAAGPNPQQPAAGNPPEDNLPMTAGAGGDAALAVADGATAGPAKAPPVVAPETIAEANASVLPAVESVIPEGASGLVTPRRVLLLLAGLLLVISLVAMLRRRRYPPVPADFSGLDTQARRPAPAREPASATIVSTAAGAATGSAAAAWAAIDEPAAEVEEILADAESHLDNALYDEARDVVDRGLEQYPGEPRLQGKLLEVHQAAREDEFGAAAPAFSAGQPYEPTTMEWGEQAASQEQRQIAAAGDAEFDDLTAPVDAADIAPADSWEHDEPAAEQAPTGLDFDVHSNEPQHNELAEAAATPRFEDYDLDGLTLHEPGAQTGDADTHEAPPFAAFDIDTSGAELSLLDAGALQGTGAEPALDFGFDLDNDSPEAGPESGPDWDLSADTAVAGQPPEAAFVLEASAETTTAPAEIEAIEGGAFDLGVPAAVAPAAWSGEQQPGPDGQDSTGADADLIGGEGIAEPEPEPSQSDAVSADEDETAVKLDLARAYLDMGEPDMASSLLDEVSADGDDAQRREAAYLREKC